MTPFIIISILSLPLIPSLWNQYRYIKKQNKKQKIFTYKQGRVVSKNNSKSQSQLQHVIHLFTWRVNHQIDFYPTKAKAGFIKAKRKGEKNNCSLGRMNLVCTVFDWVTD